MAQTLKFRYLDSLTSPLVKLWQDGVAVGDPLGYTPTANPAGSGEWTVTTIADSVSGWVTMELETSAGWESSGVAWFKGEAGFVAHEGLVATDLIASAVAAQSDVAALIAAWADGGRLDVILDARASQASVDALDAVQTYTNTDASFQYITRGDSYDGTANPALTWTVDKDYTSGWTGTMTIRHRVTGASLMSATVTAASATQLTASLTTSNTAFTALVSDDEFGSHPYDVQMVNGSSQISAVANGIAVIRKDRTTS